MMETSSTSAFASAAQSDGACSDRVYGPMPGSNIDRTSDSPSKPGQYFLCNSMNSVAIRIASAFESVFRIAQPPMTSLLSENGPSVTVILPLPSRTRTPSLLGSSPPVSTSVPFLSDFSTNLPISSIKAGGGGDSRYDSEWRMNVRYFMAPPRGSDRATNEPGLDRHARIFFAGVSIPPAEFDRSLLRPSGPQTGPPPPASRCQPWNRAGRGTCAAGRPPPPLPRWPPPPASPSPNGRRPRRRSPRPRSPSAAGHAPSKPRRRRSG